MKVSLEFIPVELRELIQWLVWRYEPRSDGAKPTKVPYQALAPRFKASSKDPKTWATAEEALATMLSDRFDGIGFVFSASDPFVGIDLDDCRNPETGRIEPWAEVEIARFASYGEISPSGSGVHIIVSGTLPGNAGHKSKDTEKEKTEIYNDGRYFAFTGEHLDGSPFTIEPRQPEIDAFLALRFPAGRPLARNGNGRAHAPLRADIADRARKYLAKMDKSISGQRGHDRLYAAACRLIEGFGLSIEAARPIINEFSSECSPPWSPAEIDHKLRSADQKADPARRGYLLRPQAREAQTDDYSGAAELANRPEPQQPADPAQPMPPPPLDVSKSLAELLALDGQPDPGELITSRFICRKSFNLLAAPTGIGKSSFSMQAAILWALGAPMFEMSPTGQLKSIFLQAENDDCDLSEMACGVMRGMNLQPEEIEAITPLIRVYSESTVRGDALALKLDRILTAEKPHILWLDPAFAYISGSVSKDDIVSSFIRGVLIPAAQKHNVAIICIHHTNKPATGKEKVEWQAGENSYLGSGSAEWANASRAILAIKSIGSSSVFELHAPKRGRRLGWIDGSLAPTTVRYIAHSRAPKTICWIQPDADEIAEAVADKDARTGKRGPGGRPTVSPLIQGTILQAIRNAGGTIRKSLLKEQICLSESVSDDSFYKYFGVLRQEGRLTEAAGYVSISK